MIPLVLLPGKEYLQLFLMIPVSLAAFYAAWRITCVGVDKRALSRSRSRLIVCVIITVLSAGCLSYMFLSHLELQTRNASANRVMVWISGTFVGFFIFFLLTLTATDIICIILRRTGHKNPPVRLFMILSLGIAVLLTAFGVVHARNIRTAYYEISSEGQLSAPIRIVEVSDLHMGSVIHTAHVQRVVDAVNECHPDIVVFLGDQFNRTNAVDVTDATEMFGTLSHIDAPMGVYAVLGNHDPELNSQIYQEFLTESGITALDNGVLEIIPGNAEQPSKIRTLISASADGSESVITNETPADHSLILAGRTKLAKDAQRVPLEELLEEEWSDHYLLVLDHDPKGVAEAVSCDADLVLAGHTHRGQFFPGTLFMRLLYGKGNYGMTQNQNESTGHTTTGIVSSGAGYFQTPIRVGTDTEIACIDIN